MSFAAGQNPLANILRFGFQPQGVPVSSTGTDFRHEPHILIGLPTRMIRFGFQPVGSPTGPTGTDFRHEPHILMGLPTHMVRFGYQPVGNSGTGGRHVGGFVRGRKTQTLAEFEAGQSKPFGRKWFEEFKAAELAAKQASEAVPNQRQRTALAKAVKAAENVRVEVELSPFIPDLQPLIDALHAAAMIQSVANAIKSSHEATEAAKRVIEALRREQDDEEEALMLLLH